jgi:hypothetical protein
VLAEESHRPSESVVPSLRKPRRLGSPSVAAHPRIKAGPPAILWLPPVENRDGWGSLRCSNPIALATPPAVSALPAFSSPPEFAVWLAVWAEAQPVSLPLADVVAALAPVSVEPLVDDSVAAPA